MTAVAPSSPRTTLASLGPVRWTNVEEGLHVAHLGDDYFGYVDTNADGSFVSFDHFSQPIGRYDNLADAKASLRTVVDNPHNVTRAGVIDKAKRITVAATASVAATAMLTAGALQAGVTVLGG